MSGESVDYNSSYYMPDKKADLTRMTVAENLANDLGGMAGEAARQAYWIGETTGDIVVEAGVEAVVGVGVGATASALGTAAKATTGTMHVLNGIDNATDAWRMADNLDDSFDTIRGVTKPKTGSGAGGSKGGLDAKIKPSNPYNVDAKPNGTVTKITDKMDEATRRSLIRENEAAETIAKNGYNIEQNPVIDGTTRNPDYLIEGEIFDCYSPAENTKVRNVASTIEEKVIKKGQAERVVLNLDDWKGNVDELVKQLNDYPIEGLKEVIIVYDGTVQSIYP